MNAADPEQVKQADAKAQSLRDRELNDLRAVLNLRQGRRFIWRLLSESGLFGTTFDQDARYQSFLDGIRNTGCKLFAELNEADETAYQRMAVEAKQERDAHA